MPERVASGASEPSGPSSTSAFRSLRHRNFRLLWYGTLGSNSGDWMDQVALNWLVYQLTGSAVDLGILNFARLTPILAFTLIGGVVADRVERRRLMFTTQSCAMVLALLLAVLVSTGAVRLWMVIAIAIGRGIALSFNVPARQSLISELVPPEDLMNAVALNSATLNLTRILGPALGGLLIATVGVAGAFYVNAASFLAVLGGLALMRFPERAVRAPRSMIGDLVEGFTYLRSQPSLRTLVLLALVPMVLGTPYQTMLTVFAKDVLQVGGGGLGVLTACTGLGAMIGSLTVAKLSARRRGRLMLAAMVGYALSLLVFASSSWFALSLPALIAVGLGQQMYMVVNNSLIQTYVDELYRGRVLSTLFLNRGLVPLGTLLASFGTVWIGPQLAVGGMAALLLLLGLAANRLAGNVRDLD